MIICFIAGALLLTAGLAGLWGAAQSAAILCAWPLAQTVAALEPGNVAAMDSPPLVYSSGWQVSAAGADPPEPADPLAEPAGVVTFPYTGGDLYLLLRPGDYWAYFYVTVDGQPANQLPVIAGNNDSRGQPAGYQPLLAPERSGQTAALPLLVHRGSGDAAHEARIEVWRGWGQTPLRGVAVDPWTADGVAACDNYPAWSFLLLLVLGVWTLGIGTWLWWAQRMAARSQMEFGGYVDVQRTEVGWSGVSATPPTGFNRFRLLVAAEFIRWRFRWQTSLLAGLGLALVIASIVLPAWFLCAPGLALLALAGVLRPALWLGALLFGLPFAFGIKLPLLPTRSFDLIDLGVWGGVAVMAGHWLLAAPAHTLPPAAKGVRTPANWPLLALAVVVTWALIPAAAATYPDLALREWRVVFLNALVFGGLLALTLHLAPEPGPERWLLVTAWLAGGAAVALFGLWGYVVGNDLVSQAEGVRRIQAFYSSGNNLALYLDRTLAVALALALFASGRRSHLLWALLAAPQALAWLLTFSKGSLFLAAPAMASVLLIGGGWLLRREGRSLHPLWLLLGAGVLALLVLAPFLGAERFQRLLDFGQGTGFLRLQLWRSSWQMALDHPFLGVGPDNFLYAYRSGYLLPAAWQEPNLNHPHNLLLDWWTRLGLPGLLLGLAWLGSGMLLVLRWLRRGPDRALALGVLGACAAALAHGLIDVSYALPDLMIVWVLLFGIGAQPQHGPPRR